MKDKLDPSWLYRGFFDLSGDPRHETRTMQIRDALNLLHGKHFNIKGYPTGPAWRNTIWWREGSEEYAEAQYVAAIDESCPVLFLGVSVEKGLEGPGVENSLRLDRATWDWSRLIGLSLDQLGSLLNHVARRVGRPIFISIDAHELEKPLERNVWTYVKIGSKWFLRGEGTAKPDDLFEILREVNGKADRWVDAYFTCSLSPDDVEALDTDGAAKLLYAFRELRDVLRGKPI